jgi:hypothetical protein
VPTSPPIPAQSSKAFRQLQYLSPPEKIASRTVADEYFAVTGKVEALYGQAPCCRPARSGRRWPGYTASTTACSATAGAPVHPSWTVYDAEPLIPQIDLR